MTMQQSRINLMWAIVYNVGAISLAIGIGEPCSITVNAATAGSIMALSSATVMTFSLYLRHRLRQISVLDKT